MFVFVIFMSHYYKHSNVYYFWVYIINNLSNQNYDWN